jgi:hypothetical protein
LNPPGFCQAKLGQRRRVAIKRCEKVDQWQESIAISLPCDIFAMFFLENRDKRKS